MVPTLLDSGGNATDTQLGRRQTEITDFDVIAGRFPAFEAIEINEPAQGAFKSKVRPRSSQPVQFGQRKLEGNIQHPTSNIEHPMKTTAA
jgi:hypothetical protein